MKRPAAVSLVQAQGSVSEWESGCVSCQPVPSGWVTAMDWEPQPELLIPPEVPSAPGSPLSPTPSSHHPASEL